MSYLYSGSNFCFKIVINGQDTTPCNDHGNDSGTFTNIIELVDFGVGVGVESGEVINVM